MIPLILRWRLAVLAAVLTVLVALIAWGRHITYEQSIQSFFSPDDPAVLAYKRAAEAFGNDQLVFVAYEDPGLISPEGMDRVAELAAALGPSKLDGVVRVESLDAMPQLWKVDEGLIALEAIDQRIDRAGSTFLGRTARAARDRAWSALKEGIATFDPAKSNLTVASAVQAATTDEERSALKARLTAHPLFEGTVIDREGTTTAVVARLKATEEHDVKATIAGLREAADAFAARHGLGRPAVVGPPVLLADGFAAIEVDGRRLAVVGMALIGLVTLSATRSLWWALVPLVAGWTVWVGAETVLSLLDLKLSLSGGPLVAQIIVLTMPAASHLALHFLDDLRSSPDRRAAALETLGSVSTPILWCALAGALGYAALLTSNVVPVRQFGAVLAVCTAAGSVLTMLLAPSAMLPPWGLGARARPRGPSPTALAMNRLTEWVVRHPAKIVLGTLAVVVPLAIGLPLLEYESNYINAFKPGTRVVRDYFEVERTLGGIGLISIVVPTPTGVDAPTLAAMRDLEGSLMELPPSADGTPAISRVISPATALDPDGRIAALPEASRDRVLSNKVELIAASPQADVLRSFWDPGAGKARLVVRLREGQPARDKARTFDRAEALARQRFGEGAELTGLSHLLTLTTRGVIATQWTTFAWSAASLLLVLSLAFRGPGLAALAMLPTLLSVAMVLGLMGWLGIKLDLATALVGSVALGLSVDDTFHCLLHFREQRREKPFEESLFAGYAVSGPGVLLSSLAVAAGFAVLRASEFVPFSNFGAMVGIATLGSSLGNLVLLPACLALGHRLSRGRPVRIA